MNEIGFRPFEDGDDPVCRAIAARAAMTSYGRAMPELAAVFRPETPLERVEWRMLAEVGGQIAGFVEMNGHHVENLFVDVPWQGQGLGQRLLSLAEARTKDRITLTVFQDNPRARSLYERLGYALVETREIVFHGHRKGTWFMAKTL